MTPQRIVFAFLFLLWIGIIVVVTLGLHAPPVILIIVGVLGGVLISRLSRPPTPRARGGKFMSKTPPSYELVASKIDVIEAELRRIGYWQAAALQPEQYDFRAAFGADTMAFHQWLQFIFIPNVRAIIAQRGAFPAVSQVGGYAVREFDTAGDEVAQLTTLLTEFDRLF